jgi:hypothetical protein
LELLRLLGLLLRLLLGLLLLFFAVARAVFGYFFPAFYAKHNNPPKLNVHFLL